MGRVSSEREGPCGSLRPLARWRVNGDTSAVFTLWSFRLDGDSHGTASQVSVGGFPHHVSKNGWNPFLCSQERGEIVILKGKVKIIVQQSHV